METVVRAGGGNEGKFEDSGSERSPSLTSSCKQIDDPVVYKLVRVEVDGRFVPATDDEIMGVVDVLNDDICDMPTIAESGQTVGTSIDGSSSGKSHSALSGFSKLEDLDSDAEKLDAQNQENAAWTCSDINWTKGSEIGEECSKSPEPTLENGNSWAPTSLKPDFSKLEGEICLDNQSIRELHETFRATFGRETTVKDKTWLKRRIAMGLTNSCDIPTSTFIIKKNKIVKIGTEEISRNVNSISAGDCDIRAIKENDEKSVIQKRSWSEECQVSCRRPRNHEVSDDSGHVIPDQDNQMAKRLRKPTRRYIEELSEVDDREHGGKLAFAIHRSKFKSARNIPCNSKTLVMRLDSLAGVQVPCVSRARRGRPRKDVNCLVIFPQSSTYVESAVVARDSNGPRCQPPDETGDTGQKASSATEEMDQPVEAMEKDNTFSVIEEVEPVQKLNLISNFSSVEQVTVTTSKGGIRRKHHRAWTLSEVLKLVEGVSRYGAGRWSEIKRLAFASYSYRTSVDLKDKWRNLLKASFVPAPADGMNARKHASAPIPESILLRVRQLAEMSAQTPTTNMKSSKLVGCGGGSVYRTRSGCL